MTATNVVAPAGRVLQKPCQTFSHAGVRRTPSTRLAAIPIATFDPTMYLEPRKS